MEKRYRNKIIIIIIIIIVFEVVLPSLRYFLLFIYIVNSSGRIERFISHSHRIHTLVKLSWGSLACFTEFLTILGPCFFLCCSHYFLAVSSCKSVLDVILFILCLDPDLVQFLFFLDSILYFFVPPSCCLSVSSSCLLDATGFSYSVQEDCLEAALTS